MISIWSDNIVTNVFNYDSEMQNSLNYMMSMNFDGGVRFNFSTPGSAITSPILTLTHLIYCKTNSSFTSYSITYLTFSFISSSNSFYNSFSIFFYHLFYFLFQFQHFYYHPYNFDGDIQYNYNTQGYYYN